MKTIMKKTLLLFAMVLTSLSAWAVPADRTIRRVTMSDGTEVMAVLHGDEHYSWMSTVDGRVIELSDDGETYQYSTVTTEEVRKRAARRLMNVRKVGSQATAPLPATGSPKIPVILVQFTDSIFTGGSTPEEINHYYDLFCNGTRDGQRYTGHGSYGAVRDYFVDQSEGQFQPEFTIIGPVTLPKKENYYANNTVQFTKDAVLRATNICNINWSDFDNKKKGHVDMVFIIFAGCGANTTGQRGSHIWPNETPIGTVTLSDGKTKVNFVCSGCTSEKRLNVDINKREYTSPDGIGVMCHELSHALGLPDFYDTSYQAFGMDVWSLMDYGCYASNGYCPCSYTAYERDFMGWRPLETLTEPGWLKIAPIAADGKGYKIVNDANPNEYYILENRQNVGWDGSLIRTTKAGLQVTHVDYNASSWNSNNVNTNANHQRMTIIAANNRYIGTSREDADWDDIILTWKGNLYPYSYTDGGVTHVNDSLTAYSTPAATVFTKGGFMNKDIHGIKNNLDQTVTLYFGNDYGDAIESVSDDRNGQRSVAAGAWTDLSGRRLQEKPTKRGLYISPDGRKVVVN